MPVGVTAGILKTTLNRLLLKISKFFVHSLNFTSFIGKYFIMELFSKKLEKQY